MNLLFVYPTVFDPMSGGVERVTDMLAHELHNRGYNVFYLNTHRSCKDPKLDFETFYFPIPDYTNTENNVFLHNLLRKLDIDIVINQCGAHRDSILFNDTDNTRAKSISVIHFNPSMSYNHYWHELAYLRDHTFSEKLKRIARCILFWKLKSTYRNRLCNHYNWLFKNTDKICLLSHKFIPELKEFSIPNYNHLKVTTINNPIYIPEKSLNIKDNIVIWVGRFDLKQKRPDLCLEIWKHIQPQFPGWKMIMIGDGKDFNTIVSRYKTIPNVEFTGYSNPIQYYKRAKILMMTSVFEGWGMVLAEAMSYSVVPIAFDSFLSLRDLIDNSLQLVRPFNIKEYINKLTILMSNEATLVQLRDVGYKRIHKYSINAVVDNWENLFDEIITP